MFDWIHHKIRKLNFLLKLDLMLHKNNNTVFALIYMEHANYWITKFLLNEWIFEINNHSNQPNRQVLISSSYNVSYSYYQLLPMERYVAENLHSALNEGRALSPSSHFAFNLSSVSQKMPE